MYYFTFLILINYFVSFAEAQLLKVVDESVDSFYEQIIIGLKSLGKRTIIDEISDTDADILRYNFGLTNEDKNLNASQLIKKYGYPLEEHDVISSDGYILNLMRIPGPGPPVLLVHGLQCSADEYLTSGPGNALAYLLADAKYDVWLANLRGNKYSRRHVSLSPGTSEFWNFSFHELGIFDLPAIIDFILAKLRVPNLYYIGHSQGTTSAFVLLSEKPVFNDKIILMVALAPIAFLNNMMSPLVRAIVPFVNEESFLANAIGLYELIPDTKFLEAVKKILCGSSVTAGLVCSNLLFSLYGFDIAQVNFTWYPVQVAHTPGGGSTKQLIHFLQEIPASEQFQPFDFGDAKNLKIYRSTRPPPYNVTNITTKVALFYSTNDWVADVTDVQKLASKLSNVVSYFKVQYPINHMDYYWAKDAKKYIYVKIIELLKQYKN